MKVKVIAYQGKIVVIPSNPAEGVGDNWYPTSNDRLGCVVMDTKSNLGVSKEAFELMRGVKRNYDAIGDIGWWLCDDKTWAFSWFGPIFRVIDPDTAEGDRDFRVTAKHWANCTEIPNDVPDEVRKAFTSDPDVVMWAEPHAI